MARFEAAQEGGSFTELVPGRAEPEFMLMHHPFGWEFVEGDNGGEWLPRLKEFRLVPGVNGVKPADKGGHRHAMADFEAEGWVFIPHSYNYMVSFQGQRGKIYKTRWDRPNIIGRGRNARVSWHFDGQGFDEFRRELVKDGAVPPIDPSVAQSLIDMQRNSVQRRAADAHAGANPVLQQRQAEKVEKLEAMEQATQQPKKKPTRRKQTKAQQALEVTDG